MIWMICLILSNLVNFMKTAKLNVFGNIPGYRKTVMSLPKTVLIKKGNVRDWNDDSVYSEEPLE